MPAPPVRQVRVFISSTFRDMNSERDHLVTVVFPELRDRVERLGFEFFDVDLRWGVPQEGLDGERANSWAYCKRWIDDVEPFFVCMLGQRYGWRPPAEEIIDPADRKAYEGLSVTEMEIRHALLNHPHDKHAVFYLRQTEVPEGTEKYAEYVDADDRDALQRLKALIGQHDRPVREYPCTWTGDGFSDLDQFGKMVLEDLWGAILRDERYVPREAWEKVLSDNPAERDLYADPSASIPQATWEKLIDAAKPPPGDPLDVEREQMARFAESRLRWFQGRTKELAELREFVSEDLPEDASRLCVVRAEAGTGKTALLAKLAEGLGDGYLLLTHFVGASERSSDARSLLDRLLKELDRHDIPDPEPEEKPDLDLNGLSRQLAGRLSAYDGEKRLVILLDALNQLTDGHSLFWLPQQLGPNVRLVVSCLADQQAPPDSPAARVLQALQYRRPEPRWVDLAPLDEADVREIVAQYLHEYCKELDREQTDAIAAMPLARNPLYLRVMLDVLRAMGGNDMHLQVRELIAKLPAKRPDATSLFTWVLERLAPFDEENVRLWCSYLALGRVGMSSEELVALLTRKRGPEAGAAALRIERALRRYLQRRGPQWDFFHGALREAVERHCLGHLDPVALHADIAAYLETRWRDGDAHALSELPYHQTEGKQAEALLETLTDYRFLDAKLRRVSCQALIEDYERAERAQGLGEEARSLGLTGGALRLSAHVLAQGPDQFPSQLWGRLVGFEDVVIQGLLASAREGMTRPWLRAVSASLTPPGGPLLRTLTGHTGTVEAIALTPDGRQAASTSIEDGVKVWDLESGTELRTLRGNMCLAPPVAVTADGRRAVSTYWDSIMVWNLETGTEVCALTGHRERVKAVAVTADWRRAVSGSDDRTVRVWDLETGTELHTLTGHTECVGAVAVTADGRRAVSGSQDGTLKVWDLETGTERYTLTGHTGWVEAVAVTADGHRAVSGSLDHTLKVWDLESGVELRTLAGHTGRVRAVAVTGDGRRAVSGSKDKTLKVWDLESGTALCTLTGHMVSVESVAVTADGRRAVSAAGGLFQPAELKAWDLTRATEPQTLTGSLGRVEAVEVTADGRGLVSGFLDGTLKVWDLVTGTELYTLSGHMGWTGAVAVTADGRRAVFGSLDATLRVWNLEVGTERHTLIGHTQSVGAVAVTLDGRLAVSGSGDKTLRVWDLESGAELRTLTGHAGGVNAVAVTPDGRRAVSASGDHTLKVWNLESGAEMRTLIGRGAGVWAVAVTADGRRAVSASSAQALEVWDLESGAKLATLTGHSEWVMAVAVTADGRRAVSGSGDNTLKVWDLESGAELRTLAGHSGCVRAVAVTADGRRAVSGSWDKTLRVWDLETGYCLYAWSAEDSLLACAIATDGVTVLAGGKEGHVHVLHLENVTPGPPLCTAWQPRTPPRWQFWRDRRPKPVAFGCLHCRVWSEVPSSALGTELPCPHCGKAVKLNPFVIEADWRPIAAAWNPKEP